MARAARPPVAAITPVAAAAPVVSLVPPAPGPVVPPPVAAPPVSPVSPAPGPKPAAPPAVLPTPIAEQPRAEIPLGMLVLPKPKLPPVVAEPQPEPVAPRLPRHQRPPQPKQVRPARQKPPKASKPAKQPVERKPSSSESSASEPHPAPSRTTALLTSVPFLCALAAVALVGASVITWVLSPNHSGSGVYAAPRNVGTVPTVAPKTVPLSYVLPDSIVIPRLKAKAPIVKVGTLPGRELQIPLNPNVVGWWDGGAKPGDHTGTAILAGHINYAGVQGTLSRIGTLDPGDAVYVDGMHGKRHVSIKYTITGVRTYRKTSLPYAQIFDQHSISRLAIVTCGGPFDPSTGNYLDNIVAFAVPAKTTQT